MGYDLVMMGNRESGEGRDAEYSDLLAFALELAELGMPLARRPVNYRGIERKADTSLVTETDHAIQDLLVGRIGEAFAEHAVLAEECSGRANAVDPEVAEYCWIIDPLDGTRNYASGLPCYSISIGLFRQGEPVVAVVAEPNIGHVYSATLGGGTRCNGVRIEACDPMENHSALVGFTSNRDPVSLSLLAQWAATPGIILRNLGSTAYQLALVASGGMNASFSRKCKIWDIAAGALLVTEAGGIVTGLKGGSLFPYRYDLDADQNIPVLAGASQTHRRLLACSRAVKDGNA
ncbi:MAG: inositol monophosphatase family protein [Planctomycetota bacterium]|jgi:myo-inositol-1(or 4)-monophosphatase